MAQQQEGHWLQARSPWSSGRTTRCRTCHRRSRTHQSCTIPLTVQEAEHTEASQQQQHGQLTCRLPTGMQGNSSSRRTPACISRAQPHCARTTACMQCSSATAIATAPLHARARHTQPPGMKHLYIRLQPGQGSPSRHASPPSPDPPHLPPRNPHPATPVQMSLLPVTLAPHPRARLPMLTRADW